MAKEDDDAAAADGGGNVYIADYGLSEGVKVPAGGGSQTTVGSGLTEASGVAVDEAGKFSFAKKISFW